MPTYVNGVDQSPAYDVQKVELYKARHLILNPCDTGWTEILGTGGAIAEVGTSIDITVAANQAAGDSGKYTGLAVGFGALAGNENRVDYTQPFTWHMIVSRLDDHGAAAGLAVGRVQLKEVNTIGAATDATRAIGIEVNNLTLSVESSDGTTRSAESTGLTFTARYTYDIVLVHTPGVSIACYVNGTLQYTKITNVPTGVAGAASSCVISLETDGTGAAENIDFLAGNFFITYKRP